LCFRSRTHPCKKLTPRSAGSERMRVSLPWEPVPRRRYWRWVQRFDFDGGSDILVECELDCPGGGWVFPRVQKSEKLPVDPSGRPRVFFHVFFFFQVRFSTVFILSTCFFQVHFPRFCCCSSAISQVFFFKCIFSTCFFKHVFS